MSSLCGFSISQTDTVVNFQTHEQSYSHLLSTELMSYRDFPKLLYQIAPKFRNEHRPKLGLLRSSEFLMKDLYSFDIGPAEAAKTYERVTEAYDDIFNSLGIKCLRGKRKSGDCDGWNSLEVIL